MQVIEVAAGLIHRDGCYLIARRKPGAHLAGFWEFPGGKREAGESLTECLQRELLEELGIRIDLPVPYQIIRHDYLDRIIELHFYRCAIGAYRL
jgi:mutator protein MutT